MCKPGLDPSSLNKFIQKKYHKPTGVMYSRGGVISTITQDKYAMIFLWMRTWCHCVGFFRSVLQTLLRTRWFCFPNTLKESGMLFMSVPPHQGDEWVLLISCVRDICCFLWQLPSGNCPFTDSGKTERKREAARNNEAWDQLARQENGFSATDVPP